MSFSKTEREYLESVLKGEYGWLSQKYKLKAPDIDEYSFLEYEKKKEEYEQKTKENDLKKENYYRQLHSRIRRKAKEMKKDLDLYHGALEKNNKFRFL